MFHIVVPPPKILDLLLQLAYFRVLAGGTPLVAPAQRGQEGVGGGPGSAGRSWRGADTGWSRGGGAGASRSARNRNAHERGEIGAKLLVLLLQLAQRFLVLLDLELRVLKEILALALQDLEALLQLLVFIVGAGRACHGGRADRLRSGATPLDPAPALVRAPTERGPCVQRLCCPHSFVRRVVGPVPCVCTANPLSGTMRRKASFFVFLRTSVKWGRRREAEMARERKAERRTHIVGAPRPSVSAVLAACLWCGLTGLCGLVAGDGRTQRYDQGEHVVLWHNKVGPFENPQETYSYDTLPWCEKEPDQVTTRWAGLGEALEGNALEASDYAIRFGENTPRTTVCAMVLDADAAQTFRFAVENHYFANLVLDELPIWAMVGEARASGNGTGSTEFFLFTHKRFSIARNRDRLIEVNMTNENPVRIEANARMALSYEVSWLNTSKAFSQRFRRFLDEDFFEHQIHWFSIFNSFMMVIFLVGLVGLILMRTLKSDLHRYTRNLDEEDALGGDADDTGWKQVQSDVFRFPPYLPLLCGLLGTGVQLILMVYFTTIFCLLGDLYIGRGAISATAVMVYAVASVAGGFVSARFYVQSRGTAWVKTMLVTACGFSGAVVGVSALLNTLAIAWSSLAAIPFGTIVIIFLIWFLLSCPLVLLGTVIGRNTASPFVPPTRISQIPRQIPEKRWYLQPYVMVPVGGLLPFGSIFIEMYFIFTSFWHYKFYYVYGFALLVFSILLVVSACVSIVMTYFLLNAEDYRWPWAVSRVFARESVRCLPNASLKC